MRELELDERLSNKNTEYPKDALLVTKFFNRFLKYERFSIFIYHLDDQVNLWRNFRIYLLTRTAIDIIERMESMNATEAERMEKAEKECDSSDETIREDFHVH
ncbi:hypothetical protein F8M41_003082 [Gigaspora margarita]|uniref:Uncharacterized protein n=1 Tax=Gigaspora margarita TaxID=4874 RepID=A0A8H3XDB1_GIGMA|nr:hypothetical protein F8M41_003082 [Gigaspora margarita]